VRWRPKTPLAPATITVVFVFDSMPGEVAGRNVTY
jgi:hypothetical protein